MSCLIHPSNVCHGISLTDMINMKNMECRAMFDIMTIPKQTYLISRSFKNRFGIFMFVNILRGFLRHIGASSKTFIIIA